MSSPYEPHQQNSSMAFLRIYFYYCLIMRLRMGMCTQDGSLQRSEMSDPCMVEVISSCEPPKVGAWNPAQMFFKSRTCFWQLSQLSTPSVVFLCLMPLSELGHMCYCVVIETKPQSPRGIRTCCVGWLRHPVSILEEPDENEYRAERLSYVELVPNLNTSGVASGSSASWCFFLSVQQPILCIFCRRSWAFGL